MESFRITFIGLDGPKSGRKSRADIATEAAVMLRSMGATLGRCWPDTGLQHGPEPRPGSHCPVCRDPEGIRCCEFGHDR